MVLSVIALLLATAAAVGAEETYTFDYRAAVGYNVFGEGISIGVESHDIGGRTVYASDHHSVVAVGASDAVWGDEAALATCPYSSWQDSFCQEDDWVADCGARVHTATYADYVVVALPTILVTEDLDVCGATSGAVTVQFVQ